MNAVCLFLRQRPSESALRKLQSNWKAVQRRGASICIFNMRLMMLEHFFFFFPTMPLRSTTCGLVISRRVIHTHNRMPIVQSKWPPTSTSSSEWSLDAAANSWRLGSVCSEPTCCGVTLSRGVPPSQLTAKSTQTDFPMDKSLMIRGILQEARARRR